MSEWVDVGPVEKIGAGERATLTIEGVPVVVFNVGGELFALADECSNELYPLSDGEVEGEVVICAKHGASFSLRTGEDVAPPAYEPVATFPVRESPRDGYKSALNSAKGPSDSSDCQRRS